MRSRSSRLPGPTSRRGGADVVVVVLDAARIVGAADMALVEKYRGAVRQVRGELWWR